MAPSAQSSGVGVESIALAPWFSAQKYWAEQVLPLCSGRFAGEIGIATVMPAVMFSFSLL